MSSIEEKVEHNSAGKSRPDKEKEKTTDKGILLQVPVNNTHSNSNSTLDETVKPKDTGGPPGSSTSSGVGSPGSTKHSTSSSSSFSRSNTSCYSQESIGADTISLPPEQSMATGLSAGGGRTVSDPSIRLSAVMSGVGIEDKSELVSQLLEQVVELKMEVARLQEENKKLQKIRNEVDDELHQLTENLFGEAYKMVDEAKGERVTAEKKLADATGMIDAMETRMSALNNLIHTKPGSSSSLLQPPSHKHHRRSSVRKLVKKLTKARHSKTKGHIEVVEHGSVMKGIHQLQGGEMLSEDIAEFHSWSETGFPTTPPETHPYFDDVYRLDVSPCLTFRNSELSHQVLHAVQTNTVMLESLVNSSGTPMDERPCSLTGDTSSPCSYRLKIQGSDQWHFISANSRDRIVTVCDFYNFIDYVQKGIIKKDEKELFWQVSRHRALIHIANLNLCLLEHIPSPAV